MYLVLIDTGCHSTVVPNSKKIVTDKDMLVKQLVKHGKLRLERSYFTTGQGRMAELIHRENGWYLPIYLEEYKDSMLDIPVNEGNMFTLREVPGKLE